MSSTVFGIGALIAAFLWLKLFLGKAPAFVGLFFLTFSAPMMSMSVQMRSYMLLMLLIFLALYFYELFLHQRLLKYLILSNVMLLVALCTHYVTSLLILTLGVLMAMRFIAGSLTRKETVVWGITQLVLLGVCLFCLSHIQSIAATPMNAYLWKSRLYSVRQFSPIVATFIQFTRFINFASSSWWIVFLLSFFSGLYALGRQSWSSATKLLLRMEKPLLVILPFAIAMTTFNLRIYPLGPTRHSLWLIPFAAAGISAAFIPLFKRFPRAGGLLVAPLLIVWCFSAAWPTVFQPERDLSPDMMRKTASLIRNHVPKQELMVMDRCSMNVLDYYLARKTVNRRIDLGNGYFEHHFDGYRVIEVPAFTFLEYDVESEWKNLQEVLGSKTFEPLWVVQLGCNYPKDLLFDLRDFPLRKNLSRHTYGDNILYRIKFISETEQASSDKTDSPQS
jgi:hypothetical protein